LDLPFFGSAWVDTIYNSSAKVDCPRIALSIKTTKQGIISSALRSAAVESAYNIDNNEHAYAGQVNSFTYIWVGVFSNLV